MVEANRKAVVPENPKLKVLDLFSGIIGGFSLGLERTGGFRTVAFCEIEPFCRRVLAKHWPGVPCYDDVRTVTADRLRTDGIAVDVICGGFPCQDISVAGKRAGIEGDRSSLWSEIARLAGELRPRFVIVENVSALLSSGLDRVLGDLASLGFDAEWHCIPASAVGAPHRRDRVWLVAYPERERPAARATRPCGEASLSDVNRDDARAPAERTLIEPWLAGRGDDVADAYDTGRQQQWGPVSIQPEQLAAQCGRGWPAEPDVCRVVDGVPSRVDRLRALGNAVVPQIPELIGRAILASLEQGEAA
jgi:DNA (cytosine-5)-methyltransferase 1